MDEDGGMEEEKETEWDAAAVKFAEAVAIACVGKMKVRYCWLRPVNNGAHA